MRKLLFACLCLPLMNALPVMACSVCFGDPGDPQTKGVQAAILTLGGIAYATVLTILAVIGLRWYKFHKSANAPES